MKRFGLRQKVLVPFQMPFNRTDKAKKSQHDYSMSIKENIKIWETREKTMLRGESDASPTHEDSYMMWNVSVMRLRIVPPSKEKADDEKLTLTHATKGEDEIFILQKPISCIFPLLKLIIEYYYKFFYSLKFYFEDFILIRRH